MLLSIIILLNVMSTTLETSTTYGHSPNDGRGSYPTKSPFSTTMDSESLGFSSSMATTTAISSFIGVDVNKMCHLGGFYDAISALCFKQMSSNSFYNAQQTCKELIGSGNLPCINSQEMNNFIQRLPYSFCNYVKSEPDGVLLWTGVNPDGKCLSNGETDVYSNFNDDSDYNNTLCIPMRLSDGKWFRIDCDAIFPFYCSYLPSVELCPLGYVYFGHTNSCYQVSQYSIEISFESAQTRCQNSKASLVSIHDKYENDFILILAQSSSLKRVNSVWIGLAAYNSTVFWLDGSDLNFENFEPNSTMIADFCGTMWTNRSSNLLGNWHEDYCGSFHSTYVCKIESSTE